MNQVYRQISTALFRDRVTQHARVERFHAGLPQRVLLDFAHGARFCLVRDLLAGTRRSSRTLREQNQQTSSHERDISYVENSGSNRAKPDVEEVSRIAIYPSIDYIPDPTATDQRESQDLKIARTRGEKSI